jgi:hypothetical protein
VSKRERDWGSRGVQILADSFSLFAAVESVGFIAKSVSLLYSINAAILLRVSELQSGGGSNPSFSLYF